jgi:hypothetical protein
VQYGGAAGDTLAIDRDRREEVQGTAEKFKRWTEGPHPGSNDETGDAPKPALRCNQNIGDQVVGGGVETIRTARPVQVRLGVIPK